MKEVFKFLNELKQHNDREWFNANKQSYIAVKDKIENLTERLIAAVSAVDNQAQSLRVDDCTYRIYRDTRFSPDKTPYKTHIGIFINPPRGKKSLRCGYYLHIEPGKCLFAAGTICHPAPVLKAIRQSIYDETDEYIGIVESKEFKEVFTNVGENLLKTAPKGFPKDWMYINYLKPKDYCCSCNLSDKFMLSNDLPKALERHIRQAKRFNDFINYVIDDFEP